MKPKRGRTFRAEKIVQSYNCFICGRRSGPGQVITLYLGDTKQGFACPHHRIPEGYRERDDDTGRDKEVEKT